MRWQYAFMGDRISAEIGNRDALGTIAIWRAWKFSKKLGLDYVHGDGTTHCMYTGKSNWLWAVKQENWLGTENIFKVTDFNGIILPKYHTHWNL